MITKTINTKIEIISFTFKNQNSVDSSLQTEKTYI